MADQLDVTGGGRNGSVPAGHAATTTGQGNGPNGTGKPDSPTKLTKPSWKYIAHKTLREFGDDQCTDLAAALTYYSVLALFPALLALVSLLGLFGQAGKTEQLVGVLSDMGAGSVADTIKTPLEQLTQNSSAGLGLIIGIAGALWSASGYVGAFDRAMNRIYEIPEGRPFWKLRPLMIIITLAAVILAGLVAIGLVVSGPVARAIGDTIRLGETAVTVWGIVKWPVLLGLAAVVVAILYYATPNVQQPKFRWISLGAVVAIITWCSPRRCSACTFPRGRPGPARRGGKGSRRCRCHGMSSACWMVSKGVAAGSGVRVTAGLPQR
jgi:membrane protein